MANPLDNRYLTRGQAAVADIDVGLRQYMLKVYNFMSVGLVVTGLVAYFVAQSEDLLRAIYFSPLRWVVMLAPIGFALLFGFRIQQMRASTAQMLYWAFAAVMGLSLSFIFIVYTNASVARVFFISAGTFAGMSLYGYTTKRDLSAFGTFMLMGVVGLFVALIANMFWQNDTFSLVIAAVGVLVFAGLTAYDTQKIKSDYYVYSGDSLAKAAIIGALNLYLDFINMFLFLLRFMGQRR